MKSTCASPTIVNLITPHPCAGARRFKASLCSSLALVVGSCCIAAESPASTPAAQSSPKAAQVQLAKANASGSVTQNSQTAKVAVATSRATRSDQELMDTIFQEMLHAPDPTLMKKIGVQVQNGRVILTGRCKTEEREKEIIAFVEKIAGPGSVENRLETRRKK